jgi:hypothetical protein
MWWLTLWVGVLVVAAAGTVASAGSLRFGARVRAEAHELFARLRPPAAIDLARADSLPPPVARYLRKAVGRRTAAVQTVRLRHGGAFRTSLDGGWLPIRGEQYIRADSPAFVWWGRVQLAPGAWVDARDRSVDGVGEMFVSAESVVTIARSRGPELDQGALLRLLGELVWLPTAFLDERYVRWSSLDERRARATLRVGGREVTATFEFGADDLPVRFTSERYRDTGAGRPAVLTPFVGYSTDFRDVGGLLVPHEMRAAWIVDGAEKEYGRFEVETIQIDG